jgi:hypothetical protein
MVDASQRLWARHFGLASEPQNRWDIFGSDGRLLGNVDLPRATTPLEIGRDYLLAKYVDSDGIESVRMYGLGTGGLLQRAQRKPSDAPALVGESTARIAYRRNAG